MTFNPLKKVRIESSDRRGARYVLELLCLVPIVDLQRRRDALLEVLQDVPPRHRVEFVEHYQHSLVHRPVADPRRLLDLAYAPVPFVDAVVRSTLFQPRHD